MTRTVAWRWAVDAERKPLEQIAPPLEFGEREA